MHSSATETARLRVPRLVAVALCLMGADFMLAIVRSILVHDWSRPVAAALGVAVLASVCSLWIYGLWRRSTWLWWVTVILGVVGSVLAPWGAHRLHETTQVVFYWCQFVLSASAALFLLLPTSREWYKRRAAA